MKRLHGPVFNSIVSVLLAMIKLQTLNPGLEKLGNKIILVDFI